MSEHNETENFQFGDDDGDSRDVSVLDQSRRHGGSLAGQGNVFFDESAGQDPAQEDEDKK